MESPASPVSLLIHDGELADVCALMGQLGLDFCERRGAPTPAEEARSWDLVVATPKRLLAFEVQTLASQPVRIAIIDRDSKTLRSMLQRAGVDLIVRRPVHPAALRLLILHSLYRGPEKRRNQRVSIGASVRFRDGLRRRSAILADLSLAGCRLLTAHPVEEGRRLSLSIPARVTQGKAFTLSGTVLRATGSELPGVTAVAVAFREHSARAAQRLRAAIAAHAGGPAVLPQGAFPSPPPAVPEATPGPGPASADAAPSATRCGDPSAEPTSTGGERRSSPRHAYAQHVVALGVEAGRVLIGRDISLGGMRVDPHPDVSQGDKLQLALHVRARNEPLVVQARVVRDDGEQGLVLRFHDIPSSTASYLRRMVSFLPILAVRDEAEESTGIIVSEILCQQTAEACPSPGEASA